MMRVAVATVEPETEEEEKPATKERRTREERKALDREIPGAD